MSDQLKVAFGGQPHRPVCLNSFKERTDMRTVQLNELLSSADTIPKYYNDRSEYTVLANRFNRSILRRHGIRFATIMDPTGFPNFRGRRVFTFTIPRTQRDKDHAGPCPKIWWRNLSTHIDYSGAMTGRFTHKKCTGNGCPVQYTSHLSD